MSSSDRPITGLTPEEMRALVDKYLEKGKLARENPLRPGRLNYHEIARSLIPVEQMPAGASPIYITEPEPWCMSSGHPGCNGPASECSHPDCVVRTVMES